MTDICCKREAESFTSKLDDYLMSKFNYKKRPSHLNTLGSPTINAFRKRFDIYLRFKPNYGFWPESCLVIARIGFEQERKGYGTEFLRFIVSLADEHNISHIGIEMTNEKSREWALKFGFVPILRDEEDVIEENKELEEMGLKPNAERDTKCLYAPVGTIIKYL